MVCSQLFQKVEQCGTDSESMRDAGTCLSFWLKEKVHVITKWGEKTVCLVSAGLCWEGGPIYSCVWLRRVAVEASQVGWQQVGFG
jgi:hypothetical protein